MQAGVVALITAASLLVGAVVWGGLLCWQRHRLLSVRSLFTLMLVVGILCRLAYVFFTPVFYAPDEQSHFNYIKYLSENRALPVLTKGMGDPANEWEYHQPPLYYVILVPLYQVANTMFHDVRITVYALRLCSLFFWMLNMLLGVVLLKRLGVVDELLRVGVLALGCLLPTYVFVSSAINNDNLLITLSTGIICLLAGGPRTFRDSVILGGLLGLSLWTKASAVVLFPAVGLFLLLECWRRKLPWRTAILPFSVILAMAVLIYAPWAARNWQVYGTLLPESLSVATKAWPSMVDGLLSAGHNLAKTFWSVSGISNNIGYPFPLLGLCYGLVAATGLAVSWKQNPKWLTGYWSLPTSPIHAALVFAIVVNLILVMRLGYLYGMGQGRHLFPLLYPIAFLLALGLKSIPASNAPIHVVGFWITYALAFEAFSLSRFTAP